MPRWQNLKNPREEKFIRGYSVYMGAVAETSRDITARSKALARNTNATSSATIRHRLAPSFRHRLFPARPTTSTLIRTRKISSEFPSFDFIFSGDQNELLMWEHSKQVMVDLFKAMGGEMWGADDEPNRPGTSLHETGVCRFGNDPKKSVTNKWAQTHDVPNLYICDASIFPNCTDKTTTMPIVAFTMRTCDHMLDNFKKGVHKRA